MRDINNLTKDFVKQNSSLNKNGCWIWSGTIINTGYGYYRGKMTHRLSWEIFKGPIPDGLCVCHTCDERSCCNPEHLFLGTRRENIADMVEKDRGTGPTKKCRRVLSHDEVAQVILLKNSGWTYQQLKDHFGLAIGSLHEIVNGRNKGPKMNNGKRKYRSLKDKRPVVTSKEKRKKASVYKGVSAVKATGKWVANYRGTYLGCFSDEVEAAMAYDDAVIATEGPLAVTNATLGNYKNVFGPEDTTESTLEAWGKLTTEQQETIREETHDLTSWELGEAERKIERLEAELAALKAASSK